MKVKSLGSSNKKNSRNLRVVFKKDISKRFILRIITQIGEMPSKELS
jgi:hypothetical protein